MDLRWRGVSKSASQCSSVPFYLLAFGVAKLRIGCRQACSSRTTWRVELSTGRTSKFTEEEVPNNDRPICFFSVADRSPTKKSAGPLAGPVGPGVGAFRECHLG